MQKEVYEYISKKTGDPIVEWKICAVSGTEFPIFQSDLDFYEKISPSFGGKKYQIPIPTLCPEERARRRIAFRNVHKLYKRKDPISDNSLISPFPPDKSYNVVSSKDWFSDDNKVEGLNYGIDIDYNKSFKENFASLQAKAPRRGSYITNSENCDWTTNTDNSKNCYMTAATMNCENIYYSDTSIDSDNIMDSLMTSGSNSSYNNIDSKNSYKVYDSHNIEGCSNSKFLYNCVNCISCMACANLNNKEYHVLNKKVSKEVFLKAYERSFIDKEYLDYISKEYNKILIATPRISAININSSKSIGHELYSSNSILIGFNINNCEDIRYSSDLYDCNTSQDVYKLELSDLCYDTSSSYRVYKTLFTFNSALLKDCIYCDTCFNCKNCFACVGLKNKEYCIFNKQYTKEEYQQNAGNIIGKMVERGEWGEFFDPSFSPFGYNETDAMEYMPIKNEEAIQKGYKWMDKNYDPKIPDGEKTLKGEQIPFDSSIVSDDIVKQIFICEVSGRPFRIIKQELEFYRKHNLPLPRKHPDIRHIERERKRLGGDLHLRKCDKCGKEILSVYAEDSEFKVYCEDCYNKEVYG